MPALYAFGANDHEHARDFLYSALILLVITVMLGIATAAYTPRDPARSHLAALVLAYAVLPFALALPLAEALPDTTLTNAWFEMVSAFTTTGATAYAPDRLADAVHLWRATVGWFGGFLILLAAYAVLAPLTLGGTEGASGRPPGRSGTGTAPFEIIFKLALGKALLQHFDGIVVMQSRERSVDGFENGRVAFERF